MPLLPILAVLVATPATFAAVAAGAQSGDTVQVAGVGDHLALKSRVFNPPLILDLRQATLVNLYLDGVQGVTVTGGTFRAQAGDYKGGLYVIRSAHVKVNGSTIQAANGLGVVFRDSTDVGLDGSTVAGAHDAVVFQNIDKFRAVGNTLTGMSGDGIDAFAAHHGLVSLNVCAGFRAIDASHRDCFQAANPIAGAAATSDIDVSFNAAHGLAQGFSAYSHSATDPGFKGLSFHHNFASVHDPNGIGLQNCNGCDVRNNHVTTLPDAPYQVKVNITGGTVTRCGNTAESYGGRPAIVDAPC